MAGLFPFDEDRIRDYEGRGGIGGTPEYMYAVCLDHLLAPSLPNLTDLGPMPGDILERTLRQKGNTR